MLKKNKVTLIVTSLVMLIPMIVGLILWDELPEAIPSHWDLNGNVDGWSSKPFVVFGFPCILLAIHLLGLLASRYDPKAKDYHPSIVQLLLWICPVLSLLLCSLVYAAALNYSVDATIVLPLFLGTLLIFIGNLLPKCRQSRTMGIKLPWTLANEENWNKTHRMSGKLWMAGGIAILATALMGQLWITMAVLAVMVLVPTVYSYRLHLKLKQDEEA